METLSALLAICAGNSPVPGEFPAQRPVTRSFDVFFDLRLNKRLRKQLWGWWSETLSCPLWRHCSDIEVLWVFTHPPPPPPSAAYMRQQIGPALVRIMGCRLCSDKSLSQPVLGSCQLDSLGTNFSDILSKVQNFLFTKMHLTILFSEWRPFCPGWGRLRYKYNVHAWLVLIPVSCASHVEPYRQETGLDRTWLILFRHNNSTH